MSDFSIIELTPETIADYGICGYKDAKKHVELQKKIDWYRDYYPKGLRIQALVTGDGQYQGMIEYVPGTYAHRPVNAEPFMFIHCIFVGFKKEFKGRGFASALIDACLEDAKKSGLAGVALVTRKGSFMVDKEIFVKKGFAVVDAAAPDFELLVKKTDASAPDPSFKKSVHESIEKYGSGLTILRSAQCPYTEKNVNAIIENARDMGLEVNLIELSDHLSVQENPCAFGSFAIIHNGEIISHHPISNTRFTNIMKKRVD
jgi:GNAT superfamily N-acetyltransferase